METNADPESPARLAGPTPARRKRGVTCQLNRRELSGAIPCRHEIEGLVCRWRATLRIWLLIECLGDAVYGAETHFHMVTPKGKHGRRLLVSCRRESDRGTCVSYLCDPLPGSLTGTLPSQTNARNAATIFAARRIDAPSVAISCLPASESRNDGNAISAHESSRRCLYVQAKGRGGKIAYSAARKPSGKLVDAVPDGYEIYEHPDNAQVFVRKIKPTKILPIERQLVETAIRKLAKLDYFIVNVEEESIVIYLTDAEPDASLGFMRSFAPMTADQAASAKKFIISHARYSKMMRFVLTDETSRAFNVERWCFLGSIDDWYFLGGGEKAR